MVHDLFYRSHPFERQLSLHFRIVGEVFFKLIIRISDSQRPSPASEWQLTIWLILFYHVFRAVSTFFSCLSMDNVLACLFLLLLIFLRRSKVVWHTILNSGNLCATNCSFFLQKVLKAAPAWHTNPEFTTLCAKVIRCPAERRRPAGTQIPILPLCVPKFPAARPRDSAGMASKMHFYFTKVPHAAKKVNKSL